MWHIVLETQSGAMMTVYVLVGVLPTFFTSLFGGVWADRYNKKYIINLADGSIALASLAIAICLSAGIDSIVLLMVAAAIRALGQGVQQPAVSSLIPFIVPEDKLLKINGINGSIQSGIFILSPIVSASLMALAPLKILFLIDVVTASIAIIILYFLVKTPRTVSKIEKAEKTSHLRDMINGLIYIKSQKYLYILVILSTIYMIAMTPLSIMSPLQVTRNFGPELWRLSAIEITFAGGMMLGGALVGIWYFRNKIYSMGMAGAISGIMTILFGLWTNFIPYLVCMAICGIIVAYYSAPNMTLLQEKVAPEYLGRVMSVFTMLGSIAMPFGMLFFGPLGDLVNINYIMIVSGTVMLSLGMIYFYNKTLRKAGVKEKK
jgi:DHA3 family macrolide efflux protein-like MFS transporter